MVYSGGISVDNQLENERWCKRSRPMREYFMGSAVGPVSSAAQHFSKLLRDPLSTLDV